METTGGDTYWINGKNKEQNRSIHNMVKVGITDSNQHENKWFCAAETSAEVHIYRIDSALDNIPPHFAWYSKNPSIHEIKSCGCDKYPITPYPKKLDDRTQERSFMGYTSIISIKKWWNPQTKRFKYCSYLKFDEHNNTFDKGWSPGYELMLGTNVSIPATLKVTSHIIYLSNVIYLKAMLIFLQEALLVALANTKVNMTTCQ